MVAGSIRTAGGCLVDAIAEWLLAQALGEPETECLVDGCFNRLRAAGIPLRDAQVELRTLHPLFRAVRFTWRWGEDMEITPIPHDPALAEEHLPDPFGDMAKKQIPILRRRLTGETALLDFPVLVRCRDAGVTDYMAYMIAFGDNAGDRMDDVMLGCWTTERASGFTDTEIQSLQRIQVRLAEACKVMVKDEISRNILTTYLGQDAGRQVLKGQIKHGDHEKIHAVIWYSDLRDSTAMADRMPPEEFLETINTYFACTAGAVLAGSGEVLRFIGDAVLAIFPIRDGPVLMKKACEKAWAAALDAQNRLDLANEKRVAAGKEPLSFGLGLHVGHVMFGNIGVPERLEFTVIGAAANEVERLEGLTRRLDHDVLVTSVFARNLAVAWIPLGAYELRGVGESLEVLAPPGDAQYDVRAERARTVAS